MLSESLGLVVRWSGGALVLWSGGPVARVVVPWSGGPVVMPLPAVTFIVVLVVMLPPANTLIRLSHTLTVASETGPVACVPPSLAVRSPRKPGGASGTSILDRFKKGITN